MFLPYHCSLSENIKAVYLAIGVNIEGKKELLGIWIGKNEGAKFWMQVVTELKNRGVKKIYVVSERKGCFIKKLFKNQFRIIIILRLTKSIVLALFRIVSFGSPALL